jgi:hypothetical protein
LEGNYTHRTACRTDAMDGAGATRLSLYNVAFRCAWRFRCALAVPHAHQARAHGTRRRWLHCTHVSCDPISYLPWRSDRHPLQLRRGSNGALCGLGSLPEGPDCFAIGVCAGARSCLAHGWDNTLGLIHHGKAPAPSVSPQLRATSLTLSLETPPRVETTQLCGAVTALCRPPRRVGPQPRYRLES